MPGFFLAASCGEDGDVFDELTKLRALGVEIDKLMVKPSTDAESQTVTLILHAVVPKGQAVKASVFQDTQQKTIPLVKDLKIADGYPKYEDLGNLRHVTVSASFVVPKAAELGFDKGVEAINLRYGFLLTAGAEVEKVVGNVAVVSADSADGKREWKQPKIEIVNPTSKSVAKDSTVDVRLKITESNQDQRKIGWFTSSGKFKNRRSSSTKWETGGDTKQILIATLREKRTHGFAISIKEFETDQ